MGHVNGERRDAGGRRREEEGGRRDDRFGLTPTRTKVGLTVQVEPIDDPAHLCP